MDQISIATVLRPYIGMILALGFVAAFAGSGSSYLLHERYAASALVLVRPQQAIEIDSQRGSKEVLDLLRDIDELETSVGLKVLGTIPRIPGSVRRRAVAGAWR